MEPANIHPAILFEPDGYRLDGQKLMGRQAAGSGFLRAAVAASRGKPLPGYTPSKASAESFAQTVREIDASARAEWVHPARTEMLRRIGHLYMPGPTLGELARQRLRAGPAAWSLTGVTHTTASHGAMDSIAEMMVAPVMPWDALICTSQAVLSTVHIVLDAQREYLQWRSGSSWNPVLPQLPVIPLGVHCKDFEIAPAQRSAARNALGIADDEIVALFVGRLSFHAKAHPHAMYAGLQEAARASGKKLVLVQCGWFANKAIEEAFRSGAAMACPDVRCLFTDGRTENGRRASWGAADIFISLSDNLQETFGLTPIEAMAAGMPVVVTDWDGYKDTVRDGIDGFRIPTWMPQAGAGEHLARNHELQVDNYDMYCGLNCMHVAVDPAVLAQRIAQLASDAALRRRLGDAGRERARAVFDWSVIYRRYQDLWSELARVREHEQAKAHGAPGQPPARLDPFVAFAHYPTHTISPSTAVRLREGASLEAFRVLVQHPLFSYAKQIVLQDERGERLLGRLLAGDKTLHEAASQLGGAQADWLRTAAMLAKMGLVEFSPATP